MKNRLNVHIGFVAGAFLLIGTLALSQSKPAPKTAQPGQTAGGQPAGIQNQTGHAKSLAVNEQGSSCNPCTGPMHGKKSMDRGSSGVNPMYESKNKTVSKPAAGASATTQYKDPEDMTTRYRPGNNKTATKSPAKPQSGKGSSPQ